MRRIWATVGIALVLSACSKKPELEPLDAGRFNSRSDVEALFGKTGDWISNFDEPQGKNFPAEGSYIMQTIKKGTTVAFKGKNAGLWVKKEMSGAVNAKDSDNCIMRFSGKVTGVVSIGSGVVWLEQMPDKLDLPNLSMRFEKPSFVVVNSATRERLKQLQGSCVGGPIEVVVFQGDIEPGRYKTPWGRGGRGITELTVFEKLPEGEK